MKIERKTTKKPTIGFCGTLKEENERNVKTAAPG